VSHVDPEILALLALGEQTGEPADHTHLAECAQCRAELQNLRRTAAVGRSSLDAGELLTPSPRVWSAIVEELALDEPASAAPVVPLRRRAWLRPVAAIAAAVLLIAGVGATWWALRPAPTTVLASATLDPFPGWEGAEGSATVEEQPDGARVVDVSLTAPFDDDGFREVWLISSDSAQLVSLGVMRGTDGTFTIPDGLDLSRFDLVDISEEPFDGDPAHSGDSIVRGQLTSV